MQPVIYNSIGEGNYFFVDEKAQPMENYIQIRSAIDKRVALVVRKNEIIQPTEQEKEYIMNLIKRSIPVKAKQQVFKKRKSRGSGHYGREVRNFMNMYKITQKNFSFACGYKVSSAVQIFLYNPDREISKQSWRKIEKGMAAFRKID